MHATKNTLKPEKKAFILQAIYLEEINIVTYVLRGNTRTQRYTT